MKKLFLLLTLATLLLSCSKDEEVLFPDWYLGIWVIEESWDAGRGWEYIKYSMTITQLSPTSNEIEISGFSTLDHNVKGSITTNQIIIPSQTINREFDSGPWQGTIDGSGFFDSGTSKRLIINYTEKGENNPVEIKIIGKKL